jgi:hypothetical protein
MTWINLVLLLDWSTEKLVVLGISRRGPRNKARRMRLGGEY